MEIILTIDGVAQSITLNAEQVKDLGWVLSQPGNPQTAHAFFFGHVARALTSYHAQRVAEETALAAATLTDEERETRAAQARAAQQGQ